MRVIFHVYNCHLNVEYIKQKKFLLEEEAVDYLL